MRIEPRSAAVEADIFTTRPTRWWVVLKTADLLLVDEMVVVIITAWLS